MGMGDLNNLHACLDAFRTENIPGDLVETGVRRGGGAIFMRAFLALMATKYEGFGLATRSKVYRNRTVNFLLIGIAGFGNLNTLRWMSSRLRLILSNMSCSMSGRYF